MPLEVLLRGLWRRGGRIALAALLLYAAGAAAILLWPRQYVAQAIVAPSETTGIATATLLAPIPQLGGGLLDNRQTGNFAVYLDALRAPEAARMLARETAILPYLSAQRAAGPVGALRRLLDLRMEADVDDVQTWLERQFAATPGLGTVTVTLTLAHRDREAALDALRRLHAMAEAKVRADLDALARRRIAAIEQRLAAERDQFLRGTLFDLLGQHQRTAVVIAADNEIAARVVSAPVVEVRPSLPNRPLLLVLLAVAAPFAALTVAAALLLLAPAAPLDQGVLRFERLSRRAGAD